MSVVAEWVDYIIHIPDNFRGSNARAFLDWIPDYAVHATVLYLLAVFYLPGYLAKHKKTYELKWIVAGWNLFLSVVSTIGGYYGLQLIKTFLVDLKSFHCITCEMPIMPDDPLTSFSRNLHRASKATTYVQHEDDYNVSEKLYSEMAARYYNGKHAFWIALFLYLKTPELLDTVFLILQGKPVSFLHWYHHIVTALYCWHASYVLIPSGLFFATMNYCVHSIMYLYYFLVMMGLRMKIRPFAPCITVLQCLQMFIGMGITVYTYLQHWLGPNKQTTYFYMFFNAVFATAHYLWYQACSLLSTGVFLRHAEVPEYSMGKHFTGCDIDTTNMRMGMMMYGSYCVLFVVLFKELYLDKRVKKRSLVLARKEQAKRELERSRELAALEKFTVDIVTVHDEMNEK